MTYNIELCEDVWLCIDGKKRSFYFERKNGKNVVVCELCGEIICDLEDRILHKTFMHVCKARVSNKLNRYDRCPVCGGRGFVPCGFYQSSSDTYLSGGGTETCQSCDGFGYIESEGCDESKMG